MGNGLAQVSPFSKNNKNSGGKCRIEKEPMTNEPSFADILGAGDREASEQVEQEEPRKCFADYLGEGDREAMAQWEEEQRQRAQTKPKNNGE